MRITWFDVELLKNYFIRNGGFTGFSEKEAKLYSALSQEKFKGGEGFGKSIDLKAPGGMQTVFYSLMGLTPLEYDKSPTGTIEPYAIFLFTLWNNNVNMSKREVTYMNEFLKYYGFKSIADAVEELPIPKFPNYHLADVLLTCGVYTLIKDKTPEIISFIQSLKLPNYVQLITEPYFTKISNFIKKYLPPIEVSNSGVVITEALISVPESMQIIWKDLILMSVLGLKYKGLYRPQLQLGAYMHYKLRSNLLDIDPNILIIDEVHRRRYNFDSIKEFWGVEKMIELTYSSKYFIFPFYNYNKEFTGKETEELYCIFFPPEDSIIVDKSVLGQIHPKIPQIVYTGNYSSKYYNVGYRLPCIEKNGKPVPVTEGIWDTRPLDNDFRNLTSQNLGLVI